MQQHHYFVSNALGWATGPDLESTITKLWHGEHTNVKTWLGNAHKNGDLGLNFFTTRVPLSEDSNYSINFYCPVVEGLTESANYVLTYFTKKTVAYTRDPSDDIRRLEDEVSTLKEKIAEFISDELEPGVA